MAYVWPEDRVADGMVVDPRPFNRTLGRYVGEMAGMLDKDNFILDFVTEAKLVDIDSTTSPYTVSMALHEVAGPCNHLYATRSTTDQTVAADGSAQFQKVANLGGGFSTLDSALVVEASVTYRWEDPPVNYLDARVEFQVTLDGIVLDSTGPLSAWWRRNSVYLCGYSPVGVGGHNVYLWVRTYELTDTPAVEPCETVLTVRCRELAVREARR